VSKVTYSPACDNCGAATDDNDEILCPRCKPATPANDIRRARLVEARAHRAAGLGTFAEGRCSFCRRSAHYQTPSGAYLCEICGEPDA